ncbi:hypothetical protein [Streptomyces lushanensis]|uniref:hypothetical protein n=1 Tax=Streptomyces lushanensis TaxID=1434255 RepID=UPI00114CCB54|nr:hypothetical protein [Streptomyces lushanensis]
MPGAWTVAAHGVGGCRGAGERAGVCATRPHRAGEEIRQALDRRGPEAGRSNALDRLGLAEVYFLGGDLTAGCQETHAALDVAERVQSGRVREGMAWLYSYTVGHGASRPVREARARLREQLAD